MLRRGFGHEPWNVLCRVVPGPEEKRVNHDLCRSGVNTGRDSIRDTRLGQLHVGDGHEALANARLRLLAQSLELGVCLGSPASVVDEQDGGLHPAFAAAVSAHSRSAQRSSGCSIPTERRTVPSVIPLRRFSSGGNAAWLMDHG